MQLEMEGIKVYVTESECRHLHEEAMRFISQIPEGRWVVEQCIKADEIEELEKDIRSNWFIYDTPRDEQEEMIKTHWRLQYLLDMMYTNYGIVHDIQEKEHETDEEDDDEMEEDDKMQPQVQDPMNSLMGQMGNIGLSS